MQKNICLKQTLAFFEFTPLYGQDSIKKVPHHGQNIKKGKDPKAHV